MAPPVPTPMYSIGTPSQHLDSAGAGWVMGNNGYAHLEVEGWRVLCVRPASLLLQLLNERRRSGRSGRPAVEHVRHVTARDTRRVTLCLTVSHAPA